jgi:hypothetical protein
VRRQAAPLPALALSAAEVGFAPSARQGCAAGEYSSKDVERVHHSPPCISIGVQLPKYAPPQPAALIRINLGFEPTPAAQVCYEEL